MSAQSFLRLLFVILNKLFKKFPDRKQHLCLNWNEQNSQNFFAKVCSFNCNISKRIGNKNLYNFRYGSRLSTIATPGLF